MAAVVHSAREQLRRHGAQAEYADEQQQVEECLTHPLIVTRNGYRRFRRGFQDARSLFAGGRRSPPVFVFRFWSGDST